LRLRLENLEPDVTAAGGRNLQSALTETDRLARMVESLLTMARSEQSTLPRETIRLGEAIAERICFWTPLATRRGVRLSASGPPDAQALVLPGAIEQINDNLLSNALRVAPHGSTVDVSWRSTPHTTGTQMIELHVVDQAPVSPRSSELERWTRSGGPPAWSTTAPGSACPWYAHSPKPVAAVPGWNQETRSASTRSSPSPPHPKPAGRLLISPMLPRGNWTATAHAGLPGLCRPSMFVAA
jgi:hypothetical protein